MAFLCCLSVEGIRLECVGGSSFSPILFPLFLLKEIQKIGLGVRSMKERKRV